MSVLVALLNIALLSGFAWWVWFRDNSAIKKIYWPALVIKLLAGIAVGVIYSTYYPNSDTFYFFNSAAQVSQQAHTDFTSYFNFLFGHSEGYFQGEARTLFFIKITSVIALLTANNYWIASLYFSLISFFSAWWLTTRIAQFFKGYEPAAVIAFLVFPSCVFWSSGIVKESLAMAGLFCIAAVFLRIWVENKISVIGVVMVTLSIWVVWNLKYYYIGLFVPILLTTWLTKRIISFWNIKSFGIEILVWAGMLMTGLIAASLTHPNFFLSRVLEVVVLNNASFLVASSPGDVIHYHNLDASWFSMLMNAPWALFSGLFRPMIWEVDSIVQAFASVENFILLILTIWAIPSLKNLMNSPHRILIISILAYSILLCVFLALSTPNFGTLIRYRVGFLPFFVLLIVNQPFLTKPLSKFL
jgi:hypothetical protein